jgi:hypothetical protein
VAHDLFAHLGADPFDNPAKMACLEANDRALPGALSLVANFFLNQPQLPLTIPRATML